MSSQQRRVKSYFCTISVFVQFSLFKKSVHGPGPKPFYKNKKVSMDLVHDRGVHGTGPKWGSMDPWSMFCPLDPKRSQDRVFKFKLSHRSFACWQADLCEFRGNFWWRIRHPAGSWMAIAKIFPQFTQVAWASVRRLIAYTCKVYKRYGWVMLRFWPFNAYGHRSTFSLIVIPLMFLYVVQLLFYRML